MLVRQPYFFLLLSIIVLFKLQHRVFILLAACYSEAEVICDLHADRGRGIRQGNCREREMTTLSFEVASMKAKV